ncbi:hypothetical protein [Paenibacillus amylolyticus]|uniref:hypothetical protein n=1 Tax=Paenibacillus amylolyticus TaxID=1451 RepID=UPI00096D7EE9|nr:hypothetical protein [Paenibacillus amylolyticus]OMF47715.1 hypothetical protein BK136_02150 [Paenibacillus amylolyticus]
MMYAAVLLVGMVCGYLMCYMAQRPRPPERVQHEDKEIMVKRNKPSMRSPLRTTQVKYDKYKTRDSGLYAPVKPKVSRKDEFEVGR